MESIPRRSEAERSPAAGDGAHLLGRIGRGEMQFFDAFVDRYKDRLFNYLRQRVADAHRAEDLTQEVFLRVFRSASGAPWEGRGGAGAWVFAIARNLAADHLREKRRKPVALESDLAGEIDAARERIDPALDPAAAAARAEEHEGVFRLLGRLPAEQREVVALKVLGGLTLAETAAAMDCPLETVKSRLRYGLEKVHQMLQNSGRFRQ